MSSFFAVRPLSPSCEWSRRDFLALSSVGLLAAALPDVAWGQTEGKGVLPLSVGFVDGSEFFPNLKRLPRAVRRPGLEVDTQAGFHIVPADSLWAGDGELYGRSLRIAIRGLYPPGAIDGKQRELLPLSADLDVIFPSYDPIDDRPNRFAAWSFRRRGGWNPSPPLRFEFEHAQESPLELTVVVKDAAGVVSSFATRFTIDQEPGMPRLRRGLYLLGLSAGAWAFDTDLASIASSRAALRYASILMAVELAPETP
ncbi:MAG TPA: twin-arginine translocation signal domain-containing protein [Thermoanaerobaculia bacterium]|jgi:hypothetical protein|nr:twin-arginine translocation signal domain-containing protein [Thermoanaerobaculia bacterium]